MRLEIAALMLCACHAAPTPTPIERAAAVVPETPVDAAPGIAPTIDAAVVEAPETPLERLPPSGQPALDASATEEELAARYALAVEHASEPVGLSLLLDIARVAGGGAVDDARWNDAWARWWESDELRLILQVRTPPEARDYTDDVDDAFSCPSGTKREQRGGEQWCERAGVRQGPYERVEGDPDSEAGLTIESGQFVDGRREGPWFFEQEGASTYGAYVHGLRHGLWQEQDGFDRWRYVVYVDDREHGRVVEIDDDHVTAEQRYDQGVLDGAFTEWSRFEPYEVTATGAYVRGDKDGEWRTYLDGVLRSVQHWTAGIPDGAFAYYDASGKLLAERTFDHGAGDWISYDSESVVIEQGPTGDGGVKDGAWIEHDRGTGEWWTGVYAGGQRHGDWIRADEPGGATTMTVTYDRGAITKIDGKKASKSARAPIPSPTSVVR